MQPALFAIECLDVEESVRAAGYRWIAGVDEVGRGCWAGPVYAAAVILPPGCYEDRGLLAEVTDSKLLSPAKRERLSGEIQRLAVAAAIGWAEAAVIDRLNIVGATRLAMSLALQSMASAGADPVGTTAAGGVRVAGRPVWPDYALIDAVPLPEVTLPQQALIRGDRSCLAIAAASIVAKVARDAEMRRRAPSYPEFALAENKGYGTRRHIAALRAAGVTPLHRRTFAPMKYLLSVRDFVAGALPAPVPVSADLAGTGASTLAGAGGC
jgi:ribonuclease HII